MGTNRLVRIVYLTLFLLSLCSIRVSADVIVKPSSAASGGGSLTGTNVWSGLNIFGSADGAANAAAWGRTAGCVEFEGATANTSEFLLCGGDSTADNTLTLTGTATGVTFAATTGGVQFTDSGGVLICDGVDFTKCVTLQVNGVTSGTTRTLTVPNATSNICVAGVDCAYLVTQNFNASTSLTWINARFNAANSWIVLGTALDNTMPILSNHTTNTPDAGLFGTGSLSNVVNFSEGADYTFDWGTGPGGTAATTNPQWIVRDKDQNQTNYQALGVSGLSGGFRVTLSEGVATTAVQVPIPAATGVSGEFIYTVFAKDATNSQVRSGRVIFSVVAEGTTETCVLGTPEELDNTPTGTLTATIACDTAPANAVNITVNATSSLTQTTLEAYGTMILVGSGEPLPQ